MPEGTFPKIGTGTSSEDPFRPDLSSVTGPNQKAKMTKLISETATTMKVQYVVRDLIDGDDELFWNRIKNVYPDLKAGTATDAQTQKALAALIRLVRRKGGK